MRKEIIQLNKFYINIIIACIIIYSCNSNTKKREVECIYIEDIKAKKVYNDSIFFTGIIEIDSFYVIPPYFPVNILEKRFDCRLKCDFSYIPDIYFMLLKPGNDIQKVFLINSLENNFGAYSVKDSSEIFKRLFVKSGIFYKKQ